MTKREYQFFKILFITSFFAFGLFYEYIACVFCGIAGLFYFVMAMQKKKMVFYLNPESVILCIIVMMYLITCIYGVDAGMSLIGFFKILTIFFFMCCVMQLTEQERDSMLMLIPISGCVMTVSGVLAYIIEPIRSFFYNFFYTAGRLGGFFQYANIFALFCLVGVILVLEQEQEISLKKQRVVQALILCIGILLSGSRTVFLLLAVVCITLAVRRKELRLPITALLAVMVGGAVVYAAITGNVQNVGRFLTTSIHSSTFLGRFLYVKDGIRLLSHQPFGLGYLGYYFMEPKIQTGVYSVRYIHNDFLQMALDIGILPCILFLWIIGRNVFGKGKDFKNRLILAVLSLHCLVDFDLEFTSMWFLLILLLDMYQGKELNIAAGGKTAFYKILAGLASVAGIYMGIAMLPRYVGNADLTVRFLPFYTEEKTEQLFKETDSGGAEEKAKSVWKQNPYIAEAYDILAVTAYQRGDFLQMADYKKKSLELQKYNMDAYERYVMLLSQAVSAANKRGDMDTMKQLLEEAASVPEVLKKVEKETDPIAYQIRDIPDFELDRKVSDYIEQVKTLLKE